VFLDVLGVFLDVLRSCADRAKWKSRYKLTTIDIAKPDMSNWKDVLPHNADVLR
jgi:hypothetical protein